MNELQMTQTDLSAPKRKRNFSPYDPTLPIVFLREGVEDGVEEAEEAAKSIFDTVMKNASTGTQLGNLKKRTRYVVDMSERIQKGIETGSIKLTTNKYGETFAQVLDSTGKFGKKLPIKKEDFITGVDPVTMAMAMQMKAMQEKLEEIAEQLERIDKNVKEVLQGQQNDRIAQYYTGASLYIESMSIGSEEMRRILVSQSLKALTDAIYKLRLNMQADIRYLETEGYKDAKKQRAKLIDDRIRQINEEYAYIHQSEILKAAIYAKEREFGAMSAVLREYSFFIEENISKKANFLAQCDMSDNGTNRGIWEKRAHLKLDVSDVEKQLTEKEKTLYLSYEGE